MMRNGASGDELYSYGFQFSQNLVRSRAKDIAAAPSSVLLEIAQGESNLAEALAREDQTACAQFGFEGLQASTVRGLSAATQSQMKGLAPLMFQAAYEGHAHPVARPVQPNADDARALVAAVQAQGLTKAETTTFFGSNPGSEDVKTKCRITRALYAGIARMPKDQSVRWTSSLLRSSESDHNG
jgi:hypothetical protein